MPRPTAATALIRPSSLASPCRLRAGATIAALPSMLDWSRNRFMPRARAKRRPRLPASVCTCVCVCTRARARVCAASIHDNS